MSTVCEVHTNPFVYVSLLAAMNASPAQVAVTEPNMGASKSSCNTGGNLHNMQRKAHFLCTCSVAHQAADTARHALTVLTEVQKYLMHSSPPAVKEGLWVGEGD